MFEELSFNFYIEDNHGIDYQNTHDNRSGTKHIWIDYDGTVQFYITDRDIGNEIILYPKMMEAIVEQIREYGLCRIEQKITFIEKH